MVKNANAIGDTAAAASLTATDPTNGGSFWLSTAEAKALDLTGAISSMDGYVGFSNTVSYAYNDSSGVPAGQYDFSAVVAHEFSEIMGRTMFDGEAFGNGLQAYTPLDLFHYSKAGVRDFSGTTTGYFSADGGVTNLGNFNTNPNGDFGDWAGSVGHNAYLAAAGTGVVLPVTANDLTEMNILGWDPATSGAPVVTVALAHDTGSSSTDGITSNPALSGTADANAVVTLTEGSTTLGTATANASGAWSFTPTGLAQGAQTITASETNSAGVTGSAAVTFTLDTVAPTVTAHLAHDTGSSSTDGITSNPALTGTADANAVVTLTEGSTVLGTATANASGAWSFTPTGLAQGAQTITASETDLAGNTGSASVSFTLDTVAPTVTAQLAHDTGSSSTDGITSNPALSGTADANAVVTLTEGSTVLGTTTANASGAWSFTPTGLAQGAQTITANETNSGVTGSAAVSFTLDTVAPTVTAHLAHDTGSSSTDGITSNPALSGTADANAVVTLTEGSTTLGTTTANASGAWSFTPTGLAQGAQTITASETDLAGNTGSASVNFTLDTVAPIVTAQLADSTGANNVTANPALSGTADANAVVTLTEGSTVLGTAIANASGAWSFSPNGLAQGAQTVTATEINTAGLTGSTSVSFTLDTVPPAVTLETVSGPKISGEVGTLTAVQTAVLAVGLSEPVTVVGGAPSLVLNDGGVATYDAAHSTSTSMVFDYTVKAGQYTNALAVIGINQHGATVTDVAGNAANFSGAFTKFSGLLVDDTTPVATADHAHDTLKGSVSVGHVLAATRGVLANNSDSNPSDILRVIAVDGSAAHVGQPTAGAFGTLDLRSDGSYIYTNTNPTAVTAAGGVAEDIFNYTVSNGHGGTANSTLSVLITSPNDTYVAGAPGSTIKGGSGAEVLDGSAGNVHVTAGSGGTQWLVGGPGDTLTAGIAADTFIFSPNIGHETINNFNVVHDVIDLPAQEISKFSALVADMHTSGTDTVIAFDTHDSITLSHVAAHNLTAYNFHFIV